MPSSDDARATKWIVRDYPDSAVLLQRGGWSRTGSLERKWFVGVEDHGRLWVGQGFLPWCSGRHGWQDLRFTMAGCIALARSRSADPYVKPDRLAQPPFVVRVRLGDGGDDRRPV